MRFIAPPLIGTVQMLPCMSVARVRPSGEIATDIDVPSRTVTSTVAAAGVAVRPGAGRGGAPCCAARLETINTIAIGMSWRVMGRILHPPIHTC